MISLRYICLVILSGLFFSAEIVSQDLSFQLIKAKSGTGVSYSTRVNETSLLQKFEHHQPISISLNGVQSYQSVHRVDALSNGYTGVVTIEKENYQTHSTLVHKNGVFSGTFWIKNKTYSLSFSEGGYHFNEIEDPAYACGVDDSLHDLFGKGKTGAGGANANPVYDLDSFSDTTTVDVLILYTTDAKDWANAVSYVTDIDHVVALNEEFKNLIISNSGLALKIRFLGPVEVANNTMTDTNNILPSLRDNTYNNYVNSPNDTVDIAALRDKFGADLVSFIDYYNDGTGGRGYVINRTGGSPNGGFSVNRVQQLHTTYTIMHEIGHNFGNQHGRTQSYNEVGDNGGLFQFSTGHLLTGSDSGKYTTVMHYTSLPGNEYATSIPFFSNPRKEYLSTPVGDYEGNGGPSDNVLSMSISKDWIAAYKDPVVEPPVMSVSTPSFSETIHPAGVIEKKIPIENTGSSDLELFVDGAMAYSSALAKLTQNTIKQPFELNYGFEESEGFTVGSYTGENSWISLEDSDNFKISNTQARSGSQSLLLSDDQSGTAWIQSPYFSTVSKYTQYTVTMYVYADTEWPEIYLQTRGNNSIASDILLNDNGIIYTYGCQAECTSGEQGYYGFFADSVKTGEWLKLSVQINGETLTYDLNGTSRIRYNDTTNVINGLQLIVAGAHSGNIYIDDISITAEDLYGPSMKIPDPRKTIRAATKDTISVYFYGNESAEANYSGNIYIESNDPDNKKITIPVALAINPDAVSSSGDFAFEFTGSAGFRMLSSPVSTTLASFLEPILTQGATNADTSIGSSNVWLWDNNFDGTSSAGWLPVLNLSATSINPGDAVLVYVFDQSDLNDSTSTGFPKTISVSGDLVTAVTPTVNTNSNGFTFVGNPFPASIDWNLLEKNALTGAVYVYDTNSQSWKSYSNGIGDLTEGKIKPFQGFFVQTSTVPGSTPTLSMDESDKTSGGEFLGKQEPMSFLRLEFTGNESQLSNSAYVVFRDNALVEKDDFDALEMTSFSENFVSLSTVSDDGQALDINFLPAPETKWSIPLSIETNSDKRGILKITQAEGLSDFEFSIQYNGTVTPVTIGEEIQINQNASTSAKKDTIQPLPIVQKTTLDQVNFIIQRRNTTSIENEKPLRYALDQNYPNPFNPSTVINYELPVKSMISLKVFDMLGREVSTLVNGQISAGQHSVTFDASLLSSGLYFYQLQTAEFTQTRRMLLIK